MDLYESWNEGIGVRLQIFAFRDIVAHGATLGSIVFGPGATMSIIFQNNTVCRAIKKG